MPGLSTHHPPPLSTPIQQLVIPVHILINSTQRHKVGSTVNEEFKFSVINTLKLFEVHYRNQMLHLSAGKDIPCQSMAKRNSFGAASVLNTCYSLLKVLYDPAVYGIKKILNGSSCTDKICINQMVVCDYLEFHQIIKESFSSCTQDSSINQP